MSAQSETEREVAHLIIEALNLEDVEAADIDPKAPLFREGLGLDSIDALELALAIKQKYGIQISSNDEENVRIFSSLSALSTHIQENRGEG